MENFDSVLEADMYLEKRKNPNEAELRLFLREVDYYCPLCGKELQSLKQKKISEKQFQIAHIYPNRPTQEQWNFFEGLERLGESTESFENKIALCKVCHGTQDFRTTKEDYLKLVGIKKAFLKKTALHDATLTLGLEKEIETVVSNVFKLEDDEVAELSFIAVPISKKFYSDEYLLKTKVSGYISNYYTYIRELFKNWENNNIFNFTILSGQIKACFVKMDNLGATKYEIFERMVDWVHNKTLKISREACEAVISFFIQNCEVFYEISE